MHNFRVFKNTPWFIKVLPLIFVFGSVSAQPRKHDLQISTGAEYDSNPTMADSNIESVSRLIVRPDYTYSDVQEDRELEAKLSLNIARSSDTNLSEDREDPDLSLRWVGKNPRGAVSMSAGYQELSTRISEFEDTGRVFVDGTRSKSWFEAGYSRAMTERTMLSLDAGYSDVAYDGGQFTDYTFLEASGTVSHKTSEKHTPYLRITTSRYEQDVQPGDTSDLLSLYVGDTWQINPQLSLNLSAGTVEVKRVQTERNFNGGAELLYNTEKMQFNLGYSRDTNGSGNGGYIDADNFNAGMRIAYDELLNLGATINWREDNSLVNNTSARAILYADKTLSPALNLRFSYEYRQYENENVTHSHILNLSLRYNFFN